MLKKLLVGLAVFILIAFIAFYVATKPTIQDDGSYIPSKLSLSIATSPVSDYEYVKFENPHRGNKKVLMVCTEERNMTMANGKEFSTGNHPVEMLLPILHLKNAGIDVDVVTPTGKSVKIEMWAMPSEDKNIGKMYEEYKSKFEKPGSLSSFVRNEMTDSTDYVGVFIPGGHGAMLGLPENRDLNKLLHWSHENDMHTLAICHGPAALLAAGMDATKDSYLFSGYKIASFPDAVDKQGPMIGYTPGAMPWIYGEKLNNLGVTIINEKADDTCHKDRKLITGASPQAANKFGQMAAHAILEELNK